LIDIASINKMMPKSIALSRIWALFIEEQRSQLSLQQRTVRIVVFLVSMEHLDVSSTAMQ
jgi:hypothetical protein